MKTAGHLALRVTEAVSTRMCVTVLLSGVVKATRFARLAESDPQPIEVNVVSECVD